MLDSRLPEMVLPEPVARPDEMGWEATWDIIDNSSIASRSAIEGTLSIRCERRDGAIHMVIYQDVPMYWSIGVQTFVDVVCQDNLLLRPLRWETQFVTTTSTGDIDGTLGAHAGHTDANRLYLRGVDDSSYALSSDPLTSTWSLIAAFPRLVSASVSQLSFSLLDELLVVRSRQQLKSFDTITIEVASGSHELRGFRHMGTGMAPMHYWVDGAGWPMIICGLRRALVAKSCTVIGAEEGA